MANPEQALPIDINLYNQLAKTGNLNIQRLSPKNFQLIVRQWNPNGGEEVEPALVRINELGIQQTIDNLDAQIKTLQDTKDNIQAMKNKMIEMDAAGTPLFTFQPLAEEGQ